MVMVTNSQFTKAEYVLVNFIMEEEMKKIIMLTALIGITACTTSQMAIQSLGDRYGDKHLDAFVLDYGAPHSAYEMQDGSVVYDWSSGIDSVSIPKNG